MIIILSQMTTQKPLDIIIVDRLGSLKVHSIKDFKVDKLYSKCGFKKPEQFMKQAEWNVKHDSNKYLVQVYAKSSGRANSENKYEFPPPIDTTLFYGSCALVAQIRRGNEWVHTDLTLAMWNKMYEKLYGGFEALALTAKEDEYEEDELSKIPKKMKTKDGYLKDGFIVDGSDTEESDSNGHDDEEVVEEQSEYETEEEEEGTDELAETTGSELSEEPYEY